MSIKSLAMVIAAIIAVFADASKLRTNQKPQEGRSVYWTDDTKSDYMQFPFPKSVPGMQAYPNFADACAACKYSFTQNCVDWNKCTCFASKTGKDDQYEHWNFMCQNTTRYEKCFTNPSKKTGIDKFDEPSNGMGKLNIDCDTNF